MTEEQREAKVEELEDFIRSEMGKLTLWGELGDWSWVVIGRTFKEYRSDTLQPLLDIFKASLEWGDLCSDTNSYICNEWTELRIVKNDFEPMGTVDVSYRELYCWFVVRERSCECVPPLEHPCWEALQKIATGELERKAKLSTAKTEVKKTEAPTTEIEPF